MGEFRKIFFHRVRGFFGIGFNAVPVRVGRRSGGSKQGSLLVGHYRALSEDTWRSTNWRLERSIEWKDLLLPPSSYSLSIHEGTKPGLWSQSRHETKIILAQRLHGVTSVSFISAERLLCLFLFASRNPQQLNGSELGLADCILLSSGKI